MQLFSYYIFDPLSAKQMPPNTEELKIIIETAAMELNCLYSMRLYKAH